MSTILRKGQIIPKRLGHITIHNKARHGIVAGAMLHWVMGEVLLLSPGYCIRVAHARRPRNNSTRQYCPTVIRDIRFHTRVNPNRVSVGLAPIPTRTSLYARPPSLLHSTDIEYPESKATGVVRIR